MFANHPFLLAFNDADTLFFEQKPLYMFLFIIFMYNFAYRDFVALYKKNEASRVILKKYHNKVYGNPFNIASCIAYSYSLLLKEWPFYTKHCIA